MAMPRPITGTSDTDRSIEAEVPERCACCGAPSVSLSAAVEPGDYEYQVVPGRRFRFVSCTECHTEWLVPRPSDEELRAFYPPGYHAYNDDHGFMASLLVGLRGRLRARDYHSWFADGGGGNGERLLFDVGAGDCRHFQEIARHPGYSFAGVELDPAMAERARARGYDVETGTLERMDLRRHLGRYHVVSMNHVLEHVGDPGEVVRRAFALLRPGGRLVGQLPTTTSWEHSIFRSLWAGYHFPRHLQAFSREGLRSLLVRAGFEDVRIRSTPHIQIALSLQNILVQKGFPVHLRFGRARHFGALMTACLPLEVLQALAGRSGVVDFWARRPAGREASPAP